MQVDILATGEQKRPELRAATGRLPQFDAQGGLLSAVRGDPLSSAGVEAGLVGSPSAACWRLSPLRSIPVRYQPH